MTIGEIMENFFGKVGATKDPRFQWYADPMWMQYQQLVMQKAQMSLQQDQMMLQQQQQQLMQMQGGGQDQGQEDDGHDHGDEEQSDSPAPPSPTGDKAEDAKKMEEWMHLNFQSLSKNTDKQMSKIKAKNRKIADAIRTHHKKSVEHHLGKWKKESKEALDQIIEIIDDKKDK
jgi:hypothetical protein